MKALSLTQPWATLMALRRKEVETRSWRGGHRGLLAIHASKGFPRSCQALCETEPFATHIEGCTPLPTGAIIAVGELYKVIRTEDCTCDVISTLEWRFGDYTAGRFAWFFRNVQKLKEPVPCKGALSFWEVPAEVATKVQALL